MVVVVVSWGIAEWVNAAVPRLNPGPFCCCGGGGDGGGGGGGVLGDGWVERLMLASARGRKTTWR